MKPHHHNIYTTIGLSFACLMGLGVLHLGSAHPSPAFAMASTVPTAANPDGDMLFRQSFARMAKSLHAVHSEVQVRQNHSQRQAIDYISGDCVMGPTMHRGQVWERGTLLSSGRVPINSHYIEIGTVRGKSQTWRRSAATGNQWRTGAKPGKAEDTAVLFLVACPLQQSFEVRQKDRPRFTNLGPALIHGVATWHLHLLIRKTGTQSNTDLYIEKGTGRWIYAASLGQFPTYKQRTIIEYSKFNESITISAPQVGSSHP